MGDLHPFCDWDSKNRPLFERYKRVHASECTATDISDRYETKLNYFYIACCSSPDH